jgi:PERQ amino acid-rich with GYF domain-containing protein
MVMPDRMRWIYRDPQGTTQGPWSGLEMHDWYKAGFFSPELQVKKLEDSDYEPLAQLIRRIGNSREPFLVPQIGIPHGSATTQASTGGATLATASATTAGAQPGSAQPPFASSFPSFGTTLTAEQQNALERRKQEEQYLMAIQKEHLAQQQVMIKQMHMQGGPHGIHAQQLHHHSSAHSLQSQPSYGSITSPAGYQQSPAQGTMQQPGVISGFFDGQVRPPGPGLGAMGLAPDGMHLGREIEMAGSVDRLNMGRGMQPQYSVMPQALPSQDGLNHQQQVAAMLQDRARLQREQEQYDMQRGAAHGDGSENMDRLEQYHHLRAQDGPGSHALQSGVIGRPKTGDSPVAEEQPEKPDPAQTAHGHGEIEPAQKRSDPISAQPAQTSSTLQPASVPTQSPWATIETTLPMPSPPPQSPSPLPAPSAQRHRQHIIDSLALESRSRSQTPSMDTPSATLAPWAKDSQDSPKGPSLKEIQAVEAKKTAEQELVAAAARRALAEQERLLSLQSVAPAPGLPSSANWASGASPATPTSAGASAWAKPLAGKQANATPAGATKKTLAQIQKEEETRKNRAAAAAAMNAANAAVATTALPGGKRYADLAGKVATPPSGPGGPWTTVGSGGSKLKSPAVPTAPAQKAISTGAAPNTILAARPKPHVPVRSNTTSTAPIQAANDEFQKWAKGALGTGLNKSINGKS